MDTSIQTGHTKTVSGLSLVSTKLKSSTGEPVLALLHVHASAGEAKTLEKEFLSIIKHSLCETEGDAGERLDGTLKELNGLLKGLLLSNSIDDVHALLGIIDDEDTLHVSHAGRAEAYIIRGGTASQITEYTRGKSTPAFVHIASGALETRDTVIFSTQRLLRSFTPAQLATAVSRGDQVLDEITMTLESEKERAALAILGASSKKAAKGAQQDLLEQAPIKSSRRKKKKGGGSGFGSALNVGSSLVSSAGGLLSSVPLPTNLRDLPGGIMKDLKNPKRKRRAHLLLLAGALAVFLIIWAITNLSTLSQRSQTKAELQALVEQIDTDIQTAENRHLAGDIDSANAILLRAEEQAKHIMDSESGLFRMEALDLLDRIRLENEQINNIVRLSPRVVVNLASKNDKLSAQGLVGISDGELTVYDKQDLYRVLLNAADEPDRLSEDELILTGTYFERMQTQLYQMTGNSVLELINGQATSMKTEDEAGWITGVAAKAYLRFLYVLSPDNNQIYKYERLSNRYSAPSEYNINGDLSGALDLTIDGNIYVLKEGGQIIRLFRGEDRPFAIRHLPEGILEGSTKIFKVFDGDLYILNPEQSRIIIATDGGSTGESAYKRQYVLEGEQLGTLQDLYIDPDENRLYVIDEKRVYAVDLEGR